MGVWSPGVRRGAGGHACPHHLPGPGLGHKLDAGVRRVRGPRPSKLEVLDPRPELFLGEKWNLLG